MVEMFDPKAFGKNVKEARRKAGLSQGTIADKAGFANASEISRFEHGWRVPSLEALDLLATALETTSSALLDPDYSGHEVHETAEESDFEKQTHMLLSQILAEVREINQKLK